MATLQKEHSVKRREFLHIGMMASAGLMAVRALHVPKAFAADKKAAAKGTITEKDILKEGAPTTIANYCEQPDKQPNKFCPGWKEGHCDTCMFFNKDNSLTEFKGKKYARCQLLADPSKAQFVHDKGYCATYVKKA